MNKKDFGYNTDCCCLTDREISQILMKENQLLKDRWQKLKEYICTLKEYNIEEANIAWKITKKILELEKD